MTAAPAYDNSVRIGYARVSTRVAALDAYLADRARRAGAAERRQLSGPLLATATGGRLHQGHLWELVRRLARTAGIGAREQLSRDAHSDARPDPARAGVLLCRGA